MRTRLHVSMVLEDKDKLTKVARNYAKGLEPGPVMTLMDALSDPHCYYGEGGGGELFLWGIVGEVDGYDFVHRTHDLWGKLLNSEAILENSHILVVWQSTENSAALAADIYCLRDNNISIVIEELPIDLVIYER